MTQVVDHLTPDRSDHVVRQLTPRLKEAEFRLRKLRATIETLAPSPDDYLEHEGSFELAESSYSDQLIQLDRVEAFLAGTRRHLERADAPRDRAPARQPRLTLGDDPETEDPDAIVPPRPEPRPEGDEE
jgi:hypothetical protein